MTTLGVNNIDDTEQSLDSVSGNISALVQSPDFLDQIKLLIQDDSMKSEHKLKYMFELLAYELPKLKNRDADIEDSRKNINVTFNVLPKYENKDVKDGCKD
jgi:hypothetical protein